MGTYSSAESLKLLTGLEGVIFDCDGVLVDSMIGHTLVETDVLLSFNIAATEKVLLENAGKSFKALAFKLAADNRVTLPVDFDNIIIQRKCAYFDLNLRAMTGIHNALDALNGIPVAVGSGSPLPLVKHSLHVANLTSYFREDRVLTSEMVEKGKPAPDLFLLDAKRMGVSANRCVVVEDAENGIKAAKAAGMIPLGFTGGEHCDNKHASKLRKAGAVDVFSDMAELPSVIRSLGPLKKYTP